VFVFIVRNRFHFVQLAIGTFFEATASDVQNFNESESEDDVEAEVQQQQQIPPPIISNKPSSIARAPQTTQNMSNKRFV
jgi:hypothetical protein